MKLRLDVSVMLAWLLALSLSTYDAQYFIADHKFSPPQVTKVEPKQITSSGGSSSNRSYSSDDESDDNSSNDSSNELTPIIYDGWTLYESWPRLYFFPSYISREATKITGVAFDNPGILRYEYDKDRLFLIPTNTGETNVTISAEDDAGRKVKTTFRIVVLPDVQPVPRIIPTQIIEVGERIDFNVNDLISNDNVIPGVIENAYAEDSVTASVYFGLRWLSIKGLQDGNTTVTARVYNATDKDRVDINIPITVTDSVYGK